MKENLQSVKCFTIVFQALVYKITKLVDETRLKLQPDWTAN